MLTACLLTACASPAETEAGHRQYQATFLDVFDTVTTVMGYAESEEDFSQTAQAAHDLLLEYHQLYDIYNDYEGLNNLKTVNDAAGTAPVTVDNRILDLLLLCRTLYDESGGKVNAAMGSVLTLWHEAREDSIDDPAHAYIPAEDAIQAALEHISFDSVVLDEEASTVYLTDPAQRLDVGAVAKGYAAGKVAETLPEGMVLSLGGNICVTGAKPDGSPWVAGVTAPWDEDGSTLIEVELADGQSLVTSADTQRHFEVDGVRYAHLIDLETLYPARYFRQVSVLCNDSGVGDALSTGLYCMPLDEGLALVDSLDGVEAVWYGADGETVTRTDGFPQ